MEEEQEPRVYCAGCGREITDEEQFDSARGKVCETCHFYLAFGRRHGGRI